MRSSCAGSSRGTIARKAAERRPDDAEIAGLHAINDEIDTVVHADGFASFERYLELNERFHAELRKIARSPTLTRALEQAMALPFASPNAFVLAEAELPESREILVIAHHQHRELARAIERGEGARAERQGVEHARLAQRNLEIVLERHDVLAGLPGAALLRLVG